MIKNTCFRLKKRQKSAMLTKEKEEKHLHQEECHEMLCFELYK